MLYLKQGTAFKDLRAFVKRGLSWVEVDAQQTWGKLDGVWRRGTRQVVRMTLDPAIKTVYWDIELWNQLGRPANDVDVQIYIGKNAIVAQSFIPSPESQAAWEAFRQAEIAVGRAAAAFIPKAAAMDLAGGWGLNTTFTVRVAGLVIGCSGYGAEPVEIAKKVQPMVAAKGAGPSLSVGKAVEYLNDTVYWMAPLGGSLFAPMRAGLTYLAGLLDGFFEKGKTGGRGGAAMRTNRPTSVIFIKNADGTYGAMVGGGGGGGGIGAFWRRAYGGVAAVMEQSSTSVTFGGTPSYVGMSTYFIKYFRADGSLTRQWGLSGWGGAMGAGCTQVYGLGPNCPLTLRAFTSAASNVQHTDFTNVTKEGRLAPPWERHTALLSGGYGGMDGFSGYVSAQDGTYHSARIDYIPTRNHPDRNGSGRSAGSGNFLGSIVHYSTSAEVRSNSKVLTNDFVSAATVPVPTVATIAAPMMRYSAFAAVAASPRLTMLERIGPVQKFRGGATVGGPTVWNGTTQYGVSAQSQPLVGLYCDGDYLKEIYIQGAYGGTVGKAGGTPVLSYNGSLAWNYTKAAGYSHFPVLQDMAGNKLAGPGGAAGPAVIGSEYVTFAGEQNTVGDLKSITGPVIPFE